MTNTNLNDDWRILISSDCDLIFNFEELHKMFNNVGNPYIKCIKQKKGML